jgi:hypothetical protein
MMADETSTKIDILLKALEHTQTNYRYLGDRAQTLFSWIGSVLLAILGGVVALGPSRFVAFGVYLQVGLTIAVCSLFIFGWISEIGMFRARVEEGKPAVKIGRLLHFFEVGYFDDHTIIFSERDWTDWMNDPLRRWGIGQHTAVLFVLTFVAIAIIWIS